MRGAHGINLPPRLPAASHYWLPVVKEYATARDQSIRYSDPLSIEVPLSRSRLLEFLDATYGPDPDAAVRRLRNHIRRFFQC
jgi:hypothetical protein